MSSSRFFAAFSRLCRHSMTVGPLLLFLSVLVSAPQVHASEAGWRHLRSSGIVLFRHALAPGTGDPPGFTLGDCSTQRNLNARGRGDARRIGETFQTRGIEVGKVLTSQWCRCRDTADFAFPGKVTENPAFNSFFENRSQGPVQTKTATDVLSSWQGPGALVIVTHQVNITALTGVFPASGEGIVIRMEDGAPVLVGRLDIPDKDQSLRKITPASQPVKMASVTASRP